jgi:hypothetical protein
MFDGMANHMRVEMAALACVDLHGRRAGSANTVGIVRCLLVALDHSQRSLALPALDGFDQQGGFPGAGAGDEVEREDAALGEQVPVNQRIPIVLCQQILLDLQDALRVGAWRMSGIERAVGMRMRMRMSMCMMRMAVMMPRRLAFYGNRIRSATTSSTHTYSPEIENSGNANFNNSHLLSDPAHPCHEGHPQSRH